MHAPVSRWLVADLKVPAGQSSQKDKDVDPPFTYFFPAAHEGCAVHSGRFLPEEYLRTSAPCSRPSIKLPLSLVLTLDQETARQHSAAIYC
jgi:hypothetical protein